MRHVAARLSKRFKTFLADTRGATAVTFGLSMMALCVAAGAAIDFNRVTHAQVRLAASMDAAVLHVADLNGKSTEYMTNTAKKVLMKNYGDDDYDTVSDFTLEVTDTTIEGAAKVKVKTWFMSLVGIKDVTIPISAEAQRGGVNIEVSLVLDNTGSMGPYMSSLKSAANQFVDDVISDQQTPFYSKAAIIPYNMGVNLSSSLANIARGTPIAGCTNVGCTKQKFISMTNQEWTFNVSTCVTERTGLQAYTDASIVTNKVGMNYPNSSNPCNLATVVPLTSNKSMLKNTIDSMSAGGSTAGHVGVAWGWYGLSPDVRLWGGESAPGKYGDPKIKKVLVLMTDGEYNTMYCDGVISKDSTQGSGYNNYKKNCNSKNGNTYTQAKNLCVNLKKKDIEVYTIEFQLLDTTAARDLVSTCATDAQHRIKAEDSAGLKAAFKKIGDNLKKLRLSK